MRFESVMVGDMGKPSFGKERYFAGSRERAHISLSTLIAHDKAEPIGLDEAKRLFYRGWADKRYATVENLSYDFILAIHDPTLGGTSIVRSLDGDWMSSHLKGMLPNSGSNGRIEARIIGLQTGEDHPFLAETLDLMLRRGVGLVEADLFGREVRHIAIDLKTGSSYNILLHDRNYNQGELVNQMTKEDFERSLIQSRKR